MVENCFLFTFLTMIVFRDDEEDDEEEESEEEESPVKASAYSVQLGQFQPNEGAVISH